ncbi:hypothetical protein B6A10_08760 [Flavobacterium sp. L1I52]|uniref:Uncharacterized protein n=1 Tax=Flavobacterium pokkalii TaxID=1940408 RepID=A0ABR7UTJ1_9FLAO|nr:hypothetical protein [Flavobacterium pokkalii]MBD0725269.1 hypothetical protein [Flavobacterium pokkalii]
MKLFVTILSFVVLLLSTVPCSTYSSHDHCTTEKNCSEESQQCGNECNGKCSPFYTCGSCMGFTNDLTITFLTDNHFVILNEISQPVWYNQNAVSYFISNIWQPPKKA